MALIIKMPLEIENYSLDFSARLGAGETITLVSVTSVNMATGASSTSEIVAVTPAATVSGTEVIFWYQGGVVGEEHIITVEVTTSLGRTLEETVDLAVREEEQ